MARALDQPVFDPGPALPHPVAGAHIGPSARHGAGQFHRAQARERLDRADRHEAAVARGHDVVVAAVEDDRGDGRGKAAAGAALLHRDDGRGLVPRRPRRQAGMASDGGEQIGIGMRQQHRGRPARRQARDIDPCRVRAIARQHVPGQAGQQGGFTAVATLILGAEPVPAAVGMRLARLRRIDHDHAPLFGQRVHPGALGEILGRLAAAMQHHQQWQRHPRPDRRGQIDAVLARPVGAGMGPRLEPRRSRGGGPRLCGRL